MVRPGRSGFRGRGSAGGLRSWSGALLRPWWVVDRQHDHHAGRLGGGDIVFHHIVVRDIVVHHSQHGISFALVDYCDSGPGHHYFHHAPAPYDYFVHDHDDGSSDYHDGCSDYHHGPADHHHPASGHHHDPASDHHDPACHHDHSARDYDH